MTKTKRKVCECQTKNEQMADIRRKRKRKKKTRKVYGLTASDAAKPQPFQDTNGKR